MSCEALTKETNSVRNDMTHMRSIVQSFELKFVLSPSSFFFPPKLPDLPRPGRNLFVRACLCVCVCGRGADREAMASVGSQRMFIVLVAIVAYRFSAGQTKKYRAGLARVSLDVAFPHGNRFVFVLSPGRAGSKYLSNVLGERWSESAGYGGLSETCKLIDGRGSFDVGVVLVR